MPNQIKAAIGSAAVEARSLSQAARGSEYPAILENWLATAFAISSLTFISTMKAFWIAGATSEKKAKTLASHVATLDGSAMSAAS